MKRVRIDKVAVIFHYVDLDQETRCRYWEVKAMDRFRFERRIKRMEIILKPVLKRKIAEIKKHKK